MTRVALISCLEKSRELALFLSSENARQLESKGQAYYLGEAAAFAAVIRWISDDRCPNVQTIEEARVFIRQQEEIREYEELG